MNLRYTEHVKLEKKVNYSRNSAKKNTLVMIYISSTS